MNFKHLVSLCSVIIALLVITIFYTISQKKISKTKPYILCTTSIIADAIKNIANNKVEIQSLMGPGIDPHLYKPVESDILKITQADIIFYNGLHLEAKMADIFELLAQQQKTVCVTRDIPTTRLLCVDEHSNSFDPHIWFDISLWIEVITTIARAIIEIDPDNKDFYQHNATMYIEKLNALLLETKKIMATLPANKRFLITGHDAFSYFGRMYNCKVLGVQGISTESSPGAYDIQMLIKLICKHQIPAIFIETSIPIKNILAIQEGVNSQGHKITCGGELFSDALGPENSSGSTYIDMILHNVKTIQSALAL